MKFFKKQKPKENVSRKEVLRGAHMLYKFRSNLGRDGNNYQYSYAAINKNFRFYLHTYFGFTKDFLITYRTKDNREATCIVKGRSLESIQKEKLDRYPIVENKAMSGLKFNIIDSIQTAILSIKTFSPNTTNKQFKNEISNYFEVIENNNVLNLTLDLRDNGGGNPNLVKFILQHLFNKPFEQAKECRIVKNRHKDIFSERTKNKWYPWYGIGTFKPKKNNLKEIYMFLLMKVHFPLE